MSCCTCVTGGSVGSVAGGAAGAVIIPGIDVAGFLGSNVRMINAKSRKNTNVNTIKTTKRGSVKKEGKGSSRAADFLVWRGM